MAELLEYAGAQFRLSKVQEDGATLRQHLEMLEKQGKIIPDLHINPPEKTLYIFNIFCEIRNSLTSGGFGIPKISFKDLNEYQNFYGFKFDGFEIKAIFKLDNLFLKED